MRAQRVEMYVCPMSQPNDTSCLQALADAGKVTPENLVALVGKTEGTGFHDDMGRILADVGLRGWAAGLLGVDESEVAKRVTFVLSGGCPGVITPHIVAVAREWVDVADDDEGFAVAAASVGSGPGRANGVAAVGSEKAPA